MAKYTFSIIVGYHPLSLYHQRSLDNINAKPCKAGASSWQVKRQSAIGIFELYEWDIF
jgi:hypothetical protein